MRILRGEIYYARLIGEGSMQKGRRPVVVFQNDTANKYSPTVTVVPMTTVIKNMYQPTHTVIHNKSLEKPSMVLGECITTIDKSMLEDKIGRCSTTEMLKINVIILVHIGLSLLVGTMTDLFSNKKNKMDGDVVC